MNDDVTEPRCQSFAYNNGEVQCEREWGHSVCGPDPINWHRNGGFSWNTPTHSGPYTFILADPPAPPAPEEGPEASYNVCKCGHRESWHNTPYRPNCTGSFGECPCFVFEFDHAWPPATVPAPHAAAEDESSWRKEAYDARQQIADLSAELAAANDERDFWKNNDNERSAKVRKLKAENAALSARLERVREWTDVLDKESYDDRRSISSLAFAMTRAAAGIRAALGEDA